jgi:hypothetical protein
MILMEIPFPSPETIKAFLHKLEKQGDCWIWTASKRNKGYGAIAWKDHESGRMIQERAHRLSYLMYIGEIPDNLFVLHKCDNPACCNPDHLFLGTKADNNRDMVEKGRHVPGGTHCGENGKWRRGPNHPNYKEGLYVGKFRQNRENLHHNIKANPEMVVAIRKDKQTMSYSQLTKKYPLKMTTLFKIVHRKTWKHIYEEVRTS